MEREPLDDFGNFKVYQSARFKSRFRKYARTRKPEMGALRRNLDRLFGLLVELEKSINDLHNFGPLKKYKGGFFRLSQQGGGRLAPFRLYFALNEENKILYLLSVGHKDEQEGDLEYCKEEMQEITSQKGVPP